jgi:glycosyltransferase involved in cell wall biosynthesis
MNSASPVISIIIPCYNHGAYIEDALNSIKQDEINYACEVIITDDGSSDEYTLQKLEELQAAGYMVLHQQNSGPAAARNNGIACAKGKYILPLDADNKITAAYINTAVPILEKGEYNIIYCTPYFFGDAALQNRNFTSMPFDISTLLEGNYIDNCAVFTKEVWIKNNGYDTGLPYYGHEDWEFWINAYSNGFKFLFLKQHLFYYRILANSEADKFKDKQKVIKNQLYIITKHAALYLTEYKKLNYLRRKYVADIKWILPAPFLYLAYKLKLVKSPFEKAEKKIPFTPNI